MRILLSAHSCSILWTRRAVDVKRRLAARQCVFCSETSTGSSHLIAADRLPEYVELHEKPSETLRIHGDHFLLLLLLLSRG